MQIARMSHKLCKPECMLLRTRTSVERRLIAQKGRLPVLHQQPIGSVQTALAKIQRETPSSNGAEQIRSLLRVEQPRICTEKIRKNKPRRVLYRVSKPTLRRW